MHSTGQQVTEVIEKFKKTLARQGINTDRIILFGSHAQGTADKYSDIDLVIISKDFAVMGFKQRCEVLGRAIAEIMEPIEPLAYTPEEFENLPLNSVVNNAINDNQNIVYL
ncbi:MAG: nucleotidyltransferase domain-containing protein [Actinobacteria bacterium]|nr:nucleotidyltransferase domain-containing protein [Actinomycetota bacterium]